MKQKQKPVVDTMALALSRKDLGKTLGISKVRVDQLCADETFKPGSDGRINLVQALRAHYWYGSVRGEALRARAQHLRQRAVRLEADTRRELKKMITHREFRIACELLTDWIYKLRDTEGSNLYAELTKELGDARARIIAFEVHDHLNRMARGWKIAVEKSVDALQREVVPVPERLESLIKEMAGDLARQSKKEGAHAAD